LHVTGADGNLYQRHEIFSADADADAVRTRMRALSTADLGRENYSCGMAGGDRRS